MLVYYSPRAVVNEENLKLPGMARFSIFFKIYNMRMMLIDRTDTIKIPIRVKSLFPLPPFKKSPKTLEDICNERALELLQRAERLGVLIYVFWSGGIDSTLVLVSLLKNATDSQKKNIVVLLSEASIIEDPQFFQRYIRGKLRTESSIFFQGKVGGRDLITNGELGDQVFGSNISSQALMKMFDNSIIHRPYSRDILFQFYNLKIDNEETTNFYLDIFERLMKASPIPIRTYFEYFWWLIFNLEWQGVFMRVLQFTPDQNALGVTTEYFHTNLNPFFGTEEFQLWSLNNPDKKIKDAWNTFKWPAKDIICDFTGDKEYNRTKSKQNSFSIWQQRTKPFNFMDEDMRLFRGMRLESYFESDNSFL